MTNEEFSNEFSVLLNSYGSQAAFGDTQTGREIVLDEYEKSVFLTQAQDEIVVDLYNGRNVLTESFEDTEELRRYLDELVKTATCSRSVTQPTGVSPRSVFYDLPEDTAFIVYEQVKLDDSSLGCSDGEISNVLPITHDEYNRVRRNPFRGTTKYRVLRLDAGDNKVELVSDYSFKDYLIRYISMPEPIILVDLNGTGLSIHSTMDVCECKLNPILHDAILKRAVQLALASKGIYANSQTK